MTIANSPFFDYKYTDRYKINKDNHLKHII
jgi:hypothetical protein